MARIAVLGAGFAGHTAALYLGDKLGKGHEITVVNRIDRFSYIPSWVWVGVGRMPLAKTQFALAPVYRKVGIRLIVGKATEIHPDERYVVVEPADGGATDARLDYDYLVVATGPKLDFAGTPGLGPDGGFTESICTGPHAEHARDAYLAEVKRMEAGEHRRFVIGTGHPGATCQGAAFEYISNIHKDLVRRGIRGKADLLWLSNESERRGPGPVRHPHGDGPGRRVDETDAPHDVHPQAQGPHRLEVHPGVSGQETTSTPRPMVITGRQRFWMGFWPFQFLRFVMLNLKILKGVNAAKRS